MLTNILVTVRNKFMPNISENYWCPFVDLSDLQEVENCANECCGNFLDTHGDIIYAMLGDVPFEQIAEACYYTIEEVTNHD